MTSYAPSTNFTARQHHARIKTERARRHLHEFVQQAWPHVDPDPFVDGLHLRAICEHLEAVSRGEIRNLVINIPPRHSKSTIVSVMWPAWEWIDRPERRWLCSSYAQNLSVRDSVKCRRLLLSPWYQERWGANFRLMGDQNAKIRFDNDAGGYRIATSVGGIGTGEGGDLVLVDDPHNVMEAESDLQRQEVLDWWDATMSTRGNNPKTVARVIIAQRVHEADLCGHVLGKGGYEHLCLPAEYEPAHPYRRVTALGFSDPRRVEGELLCPERFGPEEIARIKADLTPLRAAGQLQQRPAPREGAIFKLEWFRSVPERPVQAQQVRAWDLAATDGAKNDYTCGVRMSRTREGLFVIEDVVLGRWTPAERDRVILNTAQKDGPGCAIWIEQEPGSGGIAQVDALLLQLAGYPARGHRSTGDKVTRADPLAAQLEAGNVRLYADLPHRDLYEAQMVTFPAGAHDDAVDASSLAFNQLAAARPLEASRDDHARIFGRSA
jgi:predicted phage terminase large subunit-like protein